MPNFSAIERDHPQQEDAGGVPAFIRDIGALVFRLWLFVSVAIAGTLGLPIILLGRERVVQFCKLWVSSVLGMLHLCCGIRHQIDGIQNIPKSGTLVAANHQSMWETLVLFKILQKPAIIAKAELMDIPVFGFWMRHAGAITVDRLAGPKAMRALIKSTQAAIKEGAQIVIFPEGTRAQPGDIIDLKPGIAGMYGACDAPVVPIGHDSGRRWLFPGWRKRPGVIHLNIGPQIEPGLSRADFLSQLEQALLHARPDIKTITNK